MAFIAKRLNLDAEIFISMEVAQFLRKLYIKEEPAQLTEYAQQLLERLEDKKGNFSKSGYVELLLGCCLGITHTRDGAVKLICKCQPNGKTIRGKDTLHAHYKRMMENGVIPQYFIQNDPHDAPPPDVIQFRNKRVCSAQTNTSNGASSSAHRPDIEPGEIHKEEQPSAKTTWLQGSFTLSDAKVAAVNEFAKSIQLSEQQARDALQTADHVRRAKAGIDSTQSAVVSRFFSIIHDE